MTGKAVKSDAATPLTWRRTAVNRIHTMRGRCERHMREPNRVLNELAKQATNKEYQFLRLYRNLYNPEFYLKAYQNIYANKGSLTKGADAITLDGLNMMRIDGLIESVKDHSYQPKPARRTYIAKKNSKKKRPLGISSGNDKLIQEIVKMILESIYEPVFHNNSHGFRPNRSCHTALMQIKSIFTGARWFIEGDIKACFDSFDLHSLIEILRRRIKDEAFIELIWKMLKAGCMEQWEFVNTYSGTPQGSGCSPILANIYLSELDWYIEELSKQFDTRDACPVKTNPAYGKICTKLNRRRKSNSKVWDTLDAEEKKARLKEIKSLQREQLSINAHLGNESGRKWLVYVRYADDFLIGIGGSKADAKKIKQNIGVFLSEKLHMTLSMEKTQITHTSESAKFLGFEISVLRDKNTKWTRRNRRTRVYYGKPRLYVPHDKWEGKLREYGAIKTVVHKDGSNVWKAQARRQYIAKTPAEIVSRYNSEIRGIYNYYAIANNVSVLNKFYGLMKYSMMKTLAAKYRTKVRSIKEKFLKDHEFTVPFITASGTKTITFYHDGFRKKNTASKLVNDSPVTFGRYSYDREVIRRFRNKHCELCGKHSMDIEIHQVPKLSALSGTSKWERLMLKIKRKTLMVCPDCHRAIHEGMV